MLEVREESKYSQQIILCIKILSVIITANVLNMMSLCRFIFMMYY
jgi:hypothetical protein